jgi:hypothetical protein
MGFAQADPPLAETRIRADLPMKIRENPRLIRVYPR